MDSTAGAAPRVNFAAAQHCRQTIRGCLPGILLITLSVVSQAQDLLRVSPAGSAPPDARLAPLRDLYNQYHPWSPPTTLDAWQTEADRIRTQALVSNGLWPMPEKTELNPVIHGRIDRGDYTIEKVYFASRPGLYVTGSLYRPSKVSGKIPAVLCPHGHWANGRFYDAGKAASEQLEIGAEQFLSGAHYPLQARMVQLARMGCVVFHYDMIGYADNKPLEHRDGFNDVDAVLRLQNKMGLQTWNSIRAVDFVLGLPEVDPDRIACTGASGGGTQTFMLGALDPRVAVSFPAVMVSTNMQGGCVCENADYLRIGINNIALAALFAPRPMAMSGADDWTIDIESRGLPELQTIYALYGKAQLVHAHCYPQFKHNYNQVSREMMFNWFNEQLNLGLEGPVKQTDFWPVTEAELTVFDEKHSLPDDSLPAAELRKALTQENAAWFSALASGSSQDYWTALRPAMQVMLGGEAPGPDAVDVAILSEESLGELKLHKATCSRRGLDQAIPVAVLHRESAPLKGVVLWVDGQGKKRLLDESGQPIPEVSQLAEQGYAVAAPDVFLTGEFVDELEKPFEYKVNDKYPGYTYTYNKPLISERVQDVLTLVAGVQKHHPDSTIHVVGTGGAGVWVSLARSLSTSGAISGKTIADAKGFSFSSITDPQDPNLLPGALKYGDFSGLTGSANAPQETLVLDDNLTPAEVVSIITGGQ